jgi:hypothetical protein
LQKLIVSDQVTTRELTMATNTTLDNATMAAMPPIVLLPNICGNEEKGTMATTAHPVKMLSSMCSLLEVFLISTFYSFFVK